MIQTIAELNPAVKWQLRQLAESLNDRQRLIHERIDHYLESYVSALSVTPAEANRLYIEVINRYAEDIQRFSRTKKYPFELEVPPPSFSRSSYDLFLIITALLTRHRFAIMEYLAQDRFSSTKTAVIGVGSGLELEFLSSHGNVEAYDLTLSPFVSRRFPDIRLHEAYFTDANNGYDCIYAIELIEHLVNPYELTAMVASALNPGGRFIATIARNVPQFDHLNHFENATDFEMRMADQGFQVMDRQEIPHDYRLSKINASNILYHFQRR
ncbi:MAG: hypothetical protein A2293_07255 [Elusimicrobia bacterium RIFOXYB2_FULL_49_7]|nr:MAG: hypothetical protein A2293_07255 [Elusimicrobia bacterium RIFOXYB2_FULL_49_7]